LLLIGCETWQPVAWAGDTREKEFAIRSALGASRWRLNPAASGGEACCWGRGSGGGHAAGVGRAEVAVALMPQNIFGGAVIR